MTGYTDEAPQDAGRILHKPFTIDDMLEQIEAILRSGA